MEEILRRLTQFSQISIKTAIHLIDIFLVAYLIHRLLKLVHGTRAWRILGGIVIFVMALFLSDFLQLRTLHWILDKATVLAPVALVILLLPELRQTLEEFARLGLWPERLVPGDQKTGTHTIESIVSAAAEMSTTHTGALIVLEKSAALNEIAASGVLLNAQVSSTLLQSLFYYGGPLHDGAVLIRGDQMLAGGCRLPLSENSRLDSNVHMRHRAGLGVTEQTDALAIIVSEERGTIHVACEGKLQKIKDIGELREFLHQQTHGLWGTARVRSPRRWGSRKKEKASV